MKSSFNVLLVLMLLFTSTPLVLLPVSNAETNQTSQKESDLQFEEEKNNARMETLELKGRTYTDSKWEVNGDFRVSIDDSLNRQVVVESILYKLNDDLSGFKQVRNMITSVFNVIPDRYSSVTNNYDFHLTYFDLTKGYYKITHYITFEQDNETLNEHSTHEDFFDINKSSRESTSGFKVGWNVDIPTDTFVKKPYPSDKTNCINPNFSHHNMKRDAQLVTLKGSLRFPNREGKMSPLSYASYKVWYEDCWGTWHKVAQGETDEEGKFITRYRKVEDEAVQWTIDFALENKEVRVSGKNEQPYRLVTTHEDLSNGAELDPIDIDEYTFLERAAWLFDDTNTYRNYMKQVYEPKELIKIIFEPTMKSNTAFKRDDQGHRINITFKFTEARNVLFHELTHMYMYLHYFKWMPPNPQLNTGTHFMWGTTNESMAWKEGWAHFVSMVVNGSSVFNYGLQNVETFHIQPNAAGINTEGMNKEDIAYFYQKSFKYDLEHTDRFERNNDKVEGRVAGALWDLYDNADDGLDTRNYNFKSIYQAAFSSRVNNFHEFWINWKKLFPGNQAAKYSIHQNEIMYDEDEELVMDVPRDVNGSQKVFLIRGMGAPVSIESAYYKEMSLLQIELYEDLDLNFMVASGVKNNSMYPRIPRANLVEGKMYYLLVRNYDYLTRPLFAEITMKKVSNSQ